ncbi:proline-rich protein 33 [Chelonoidis abingdonii]|nr:proline-rich protein 33-like [Chelonoidis abingdonii]
MLITVTPPYEPASLHPQIPPPAILPKPGKDNLKLQKLLKKVAKKNAPLASQQAKSFQSNLSPVSEASPDLEHSERSSPLKTPETLTHITIRLPPRFSIKPVIHHVSSPFPKAKPFTLKVTEQRRISEHLKLSVSPAASPVHGQSPWQPKGMTKPDTPTQLPSPQAHSIFIFPDPPVSISPVTEAPVEVTHVTKVHACVHSVQAPRAKTPLPDLLSTALSSEDRQPSAANTDKSHSEPPPRLAPVTLNAEETGAATPKSKDSMLPTTTAKPPYKTLKSSTPREPVGTAFPSPRMLYPQFSRPETPGSDRARSRTEWVPELPEPHSKSLRPMTPHTAQKQEATVPANNTKAFPTEAKEELVIQPQPTATIPSTSPFPKAESPPPSVDKARPLTAKLSGWSRLKKHLTVEPEGCQFPETEQAKPEQEEAGSKAESSQGNANQDNRLIKSRATKMWDAILYQMTALKRRKQQEEEKGIRKEEGFSFQCRLPLLHRPRFDARKLKELASKPMTKITTMLESSLLHRKTPEETKNFNRTASGWQFK